MKRSYLYSIGAALLLAVVAFLFFFPDAAEGNVLSQHDIQQGIANGEEARAFNEATGETTRWTDALFGGMPTFQIAPSYPAGKVLTFIGKAFTLWLPSPANLLFAMMLGFFIMCLCMKIKWPVALFGALAWGFSSYFIIIIGAGHIWKFVTLAYIPPTIGGLALAYRGKYLAGGSLAALFGALQLQSNHPQMSYYFGFVMVALIAAWLVIAIREKQMKRWLIATAVSVAAGIAAIGANSPSLYNSYEYAKETERGTATLLTSPGKAPEKGMDKAKITAWSYSVEETLTLLVPNIKGGATIKPVGARNELLSVADLPKTEEMAVTGIISPEEMQLMQQFPQYFGDQPMTNGPVYVGAFILLLAILAMFVVKGPVKWALFAVALLAILLSWGHNFAPFTNFFIDHFPGYNKFRAVASILVIVEFVVPLLAVMCVKEMICDKEFYARNKWTFLTVMGGGALLCILIWLSPGMFAGSGFSMAEIEQLSEAGVWSAPEYSNVWRAIATARLDMVSADALRSLLFIILGGGITYLFISGKIKNPYIYCGAITIVAIMDLFPLNKRYVNSENFIAPIEAENTFEPTAADKAILADKSHYRVLDLNDFGGARSSYFHKTIGGYHAAKLTRYNDLLTHQINKGNPGVLNMLNAKYVITSPDKYELNAEAFGPAWIVDSVSIVKDANAEMAALDSLDTRHIAVTTPEFASVLSGARHTEQGDTITLSSYAPNRLEYNYSSRNGGVGVFSEIWFPWGWTAEIDGKPAEIGRVNYVLRALNLPAGSHKVEFRFDPRSVKVTNTIAYISVALILIICVGAVVIWFRGALRGKGEEREVK